MRIAFDVKGTLEGPLQERVLKLFLFFQGLGHEMFVWSSMYSYTLFVIEKYGLKAEALSKFSKTDWREGREPMDLAIDDDQNQWYLGAHSICLVSSLDNDTPIEVLGQIMLDEAKKKKSDFLSANVDTDNLSNLAGYLDRDTAFILRDKK